MQDFDLSTIVAVLVEMMGPVLWILIALAVAGIGGFAVVLLRERTLSVARLVASEAVGLVGGLAALALMAYVTVSGFTDAGGPVDWLLIGLIWGAGLAGTTILAYAGLGLAGMMRPKP